jgi:predicted kinase
MNTVRTPRPRAASSTRRTLAHHADLHVVHDQCEPLGPQSVGQRLRYLEAVELVHGPDGTVGAMEAVIFCGVQGSGKTTLYRDRFLDTHVRVSLDLLRTRHRESAFLGTCLETRQPFVVDNTNATAAERRRYVEPSRAAGFAVIGYLVEVEAAKALARNAERTGHARVPARGLVGTARRLVRPTPEEGFDELWHATAAPGGGWRVEPLVVTPPLF